MQILAFGVVGVVVFVVAYMTSPARTELRRLKRRTEALELRILATKAKLDKE